jgi:hypothetical protein
MRPRQLLPRCKLSGGPSRAARVLDFPGRALLPGSDPSEPCPVGAAREPGGARESSSRCGPAPREPAPVGSRRRRPAPLRGKPGGASQRGEGRHRSPLPRIATYLIGKRLKRLKRFFGLSACRATARGTMGRRSARRCLSQAGLPVVGAPRSPGEAGPRAVGIGDPSPTDAARKRRKLPCWQREPTPESASGDDGLLAPGRSSARPVLLRHAIRLRAPLQKRAFGFSRSR